ncbi:MAG: sigma-54-dependent Fis family transcriptional regulator, partial [Candidatus Omnitrophica bacterium]|nr:sigma-54-dependent Fis family transcriptional regulator [Candidatus Omnitrophota bacterium]
MQGSNKPVVMVVDDEDAVRYSFRRMMANEPFQVEAFSSGLEAVDRVRAGGISVVVLDVRLGGDMDGIQTLQAIKELEPKVSVILMTAYASANTAIEATRHGAFDYVLKPFESEEMRRLIQRAYQAHEAMATSIHFQETKSEEEPSESGDCIIGLSAPMQEVYKSIGRVANSSEPVLIRGESGAGKELVARALFQYSGRRDALFLPVNCGAIPEALLESEFFGHEKGSFTGAFQSRVGRFELADGGTLFLDEIGEISPAFQAKLLRVLQEGEFERVGGTTTLSVDVRIIAATNRRLVDEVAAGRFREDLYYRLHVLPLEVAPLRERREDILPLARHFAETFARQNGCATPSFTVEAQDQLLHWTWPGNVRELENVIHRAVILGHPERIDCADLLFGPSADGQPVMRPAGEKLDLHSAECAQALANHTMADVERVAILATLESTGGNKTEAARRLSLTARTLSNKMKIWRQAGLV